MVVDFEVSKAFLIILITTKETGGEPSTFTFFVQYPSTTRQACVSTRLHVHQSREDPEAKKMQRYHGTSKRLVTAMKRKSGPTVISHVSANLSACTFLTSLCRTLIQRMSLNVLDFCVLALMTKRMLQASPR